MAASALRLHPTRPAAGRRRPLAPTAPGLATVEGVEVFAAGKQRGEWFDAGFLDRVVNNFHRFAGDSGRRVGIQLDPPVVLGHSEEQLLLKDSGLPNAGTVWNLWRHGGKLFADLNDVPPDVAELINQRRYRKVSAEFREDFEDQGRHFGPTLWRLALLGDELPQVKSLADIPRAKFSDGRRLWRRATLTAGRLTRRGIRVLCFSEVSPMDREQMVAALKAKLPFLKPGTLDKLDDEILAMLLGDVMGAEAAPPDGGEAPPADATMADPHPPPVQPTLPFPDPLAPPPQPTLQAPVPPVPPTKVTLQYSDQQKAALKRLAEMEKFAASSVKKFADYDAAIEKRMKAEDKAEIDAMWAAELKAGVRTPFQENARKLELAGLSRFATQKFTDVPGQELSPREYSHRQALAGPKVLKFSETLPAEVPAGGSMSPDRKKFLLGETEYGKGILKAERRKAAGL